jgi:hypothetical protein
MDGWMVEDGTGNKSDTYSIGNLRSAPLVHHTCMSSERDWILSTDGEGYHERRNVYERQAYIGRGDGCSGCGGWMGWTRTGFILSPHLLLFLPRALFKVLVSTSTSTRKSHPPPTNTAVNTHRLIPSSPTSWSRFDHLFTIIFRFGSARAGSVSGLRCLIFLFLVSTSHSLLNLGQMGQKFSGGRAGGIQFDRSNSII